MRDEHRVTFTAHTLSLPDGPLLLRRAPGVPLAQEATTALLAAVRRHEAARVLVLGPGSTAAAAWAARTGATVTVWTENAAEAATLQATFAAARLPTPHLVLQDDFTGLSSAMYDLALLLLPRGRALQCEAWQVTAALLRPGGRLVFVGATHEGVRSALRDAEVVFGRVGVVVRKGGYHAGLAQRPTVSSFAVPAVSYQTVTVTLEGVPTLMVSAPGVFAAARVDEGAAALIAGMRVEAGMRVLELGCGTGLVSLAALRRGAHVTAVDVSARAVGATQRTLAANGYPETPVLCSIGAEAVATQRFDIVLANPPFHQGHGVDFEVARLFIADARRVLMPEGRLYLVANAFLKYEPWLQEHFARVRCVWETPHFRVWEARR